MKVLTVDFWLGKKSVFIDFANTKLGMQDGIALQTKN